MGVQAMTPEREKKSGVCIHGALRRQCEACDLAEQVAALEAKCKALEGALEAALDIASTHGEAKNEAVRRLRQQQAALSAAPAQDKCPHGCRDGYLHQIVNGVWTPCPIHGKGVKP